jgi:hypothetical protein
MFRKSYEVVGFVPADAGYALCYDCAREEGFKVDDSDPDDGSPIFLDQCSDSEPTHCDVCLCEIGE